MQLSRIKTDCAKAGVCLSVNESHLLIVLTMNQQGREFALLLTAIKISDNRPIDQCTYQNSHSPATGQANAPSLLIGNRIFENLGSAGISNLLALFDYITFNTAT
jgi:hypothetical protein